MFDVASGTLAQRVAFIPAGGGALSFSPDGAALAAAGITSSPPTLHLLRPSDGGEIAGIYGNADQANGRVAWSPRGDIVAFMAPNDIVHFLEP